MTERTFAGVLLGTNRVFTVRTDSNCLVGELKDIVKRELALTCAADLLDIYAIPGVLVEVVPTDPGAGVPATREDIAQFEYDGVRVSVAAFCESFVSSGVTLPASRELQSYVPEPMNTDALASEDSLDDAIEIAVKAPAAALAAGAVSESDVYLFELKTRVEAVVASRLSPSGVLMYSLDTVVAEIHFAIQWMEEALKRMDECSRRLADRMAELAPRVKAAEWRQRNALAPQRSRTRE